MASARPATAVAKSPKDAAVAVTAETAAADSRMSWRRENICKPKERAAGHSLAC